MKKFISDNLVIILELITLTLCLVFFLHYYFNNLQLLSDYDSIARLNISRKIIDSLTPGFGQLGGIWLPFPQVLFLPTVWNDFLWHSGISAAVISMTSFFASAILLYKTTLLLTGKRSSAFLSWLVYVTNINILFLQTTAMSEIFFLAGLIAVLFFLTKWALTKNIINLFFTALFVSIVTLTRYEGYAIYISTALVVLVASIVIYSRKEKEKIEGTLIIYLTLASLGIILWTIYSALIYKDPIYWLHLYTGAKSQIATNLIQSADIQQAVKAEKIAPTLVKSLQVYTSAMTFMSGLFVTILGVTSLVIGCIYFTVSIIKRKFITALFPLLFISVFIFIFLVFGYWKGLIPSIETPAVSLNSFLDKSNNMASSTNIRYGLFVLPFFALLIGYISRANKLIWLTFVLVVISQVAVSSYSKYFVLFQLPVKQTYQVPSEIYWFKNNYNGGLVLISANRHEPFMFQTGMDYKYFIYEGSQKYWLDSLKDPSKYATWVIFDSNLNGDSVNEYLENKELLAEKFDLVYSQNTLLFYRIKNQPEIKVN